MKREIHQCEQGSPEWFACRMGRATASEFATIQAKGKGKTRRTYMLKLAGERITGEPATSYSNANMDRGHMMEIEARDLYSFKNDVEVEQVGFITLGDDIGYSPDGIVGEPGLFETKSREPHILIDLHLSGNIPSRDYAQCQGGLWVADKEWIDYMAYWPKLPPYIKRIYRDKEYITKMRLAVDGFIEEMKETVELINKIGG